MRKKIIAGNWKMYKTPSQAQVLAREICAGLDGEERNVEVVLCPPFVDLTVVRQEIAGSSIALGAQNLYPKEEGAYTGEISPLMLKETGVEYVILGHSERRQYFGEMDSFIQQKVEAALKFGLKPILCVGETLKEREANLMEKRVEEQLTGCLQSFPVEQLPRLVIAYEPVWAIGTGRNATPQQAQEAHAFIRGWLLRHFGAESAAVVRIQYGGSVKPDNAAELLSQPDIDGALVGGASLSADSFLAIIRAGSRGC